MPPSNVQYIIKTKIIKTFLILNFAYLTYNIINLSIGCGKCFKIFKYSSIIPFHKAQGNLNLSNTDLSLKLM